MADFGTGMSESALEADETESTVSLAYRSAACRPPDELSIAPLAEYAPILSGAFSFLCIGLAILIQRPEVVIAGLVLGSLFAVLGLSDGLIGYLQARRHARRQFPGLLGITCNSFDLMVLGYFVYGWFW